MNCIKGIKDTILNASNKIIRNDKQIRNNVLLKLITFKEYSCSNIVKVLLYIFLGLYIYYDLINLFFITIFAISKSKLLSISIEEISSINKGYVFGGTKVKYFLKI